MDSQRPHGLLKPVVMSLTVSSVSDVKTQCDMEGSLGILEYTEGELKVQKESSSMVAY